MWFHYASWCTVVWICETFVCWANTTPRYSFFYRSIFIYLAIWIYIYIYLVLNIVKRKGSQKWRKIAAEFLGFADEHVLLLFVCCVVGVGDGGLRLLLWVHFFVYEFVETSSFFLLEDRASLEVFLGAPTQSTRTERKRTAEKEKQKTTKFSPFSLFYFFILRCMAKKMP